MEISNKSRLGAGAGQGAGQIGPASDAEAPSDPGTPGSAIDAAGKPKPRRLRSLETRVDEAARMYEKQFLREMVKAMRSATSASDFMKPSMAEGLYKEQLDDQYVEAWGEKGGLGFHQVIYDQLMGMLGPGSGEMKPKGPIPLTDRDVLRASPVGRAAPAAPGESGGGAVRVDLAPQAPGAPPSKVGVPFDGTVTGVTHDGGRVSVAVESEGGAKASVVFEGAPLAAARPGTKVAAGDRVGLLSPDARAFFVNVQRAGDVRR